MKRLALLLALTASLLAGLAWASGELQLTRGTTPGGGASLQAGGYSLNGTIGQPLSGAMGEGAYDLCAGLPACANAAQPTGEATQTLTPTVTPSPTATQPPGPGAPSHKVYLPFVIRGS